MRPSPPPQQDVAGAQRASAHCAAEPQTTQTHRQRGTVASNAIALLRCNPQEAAEALPETIVMHLNIPQDSVGKPHTQQIIGPLTGTVKQQKPCRLEVGKARDPLQENVLFLQNLLQLSRHKIRVAQRGSQHLHALFLRRPFGSPPDWGKGPCPPFAGGGGGSREGLKGAEGSKGGRGGFADNSTRRRGHEGGFADLQPDEGASQTLKPSLKPPFEAPSLRSFPSKPP